MSTHYAALADDQLLESLEHAGRTPPIELIRAARDRREALTPTLLAWLADDPDQHGRDEDDPRRSRQIHAGHLLIEWCEAAALPIFERWMLAEGDVYNQTPLEWFDTHLHHYGAAAVPMLLRVLGSDRASAYARISAASPLTTLAIRDPELREPVVAALRAALPPLDSSGRPVTPESVDTALIDLWSCVSWNLCGLHDQASRPQIAALHEAELIDEMIYGGPDEYLAMLDSDEVPEEAQGPPYDVVAVYEELHREAERDRALEQQLEALRAREEQRRAEVQRQRTARETAPGRTPERAPLGPVTYGSGTYIRMTPKVGRNDPCPCGSGRKFKHCHGK